MHIHCFYRSISCRQINIHVYLRQFQELWNLPGHLVWLPSYMWKLIMLLYYWMSLYYNVQLCYLNIQLSQFNPIKLYCPLFLNSVKIKLRLQQTWLKNTTCKHLMKKYIASRLECYQTKIVCSISRTAIYSTKLAHYFLTICLLYCMLSNKLPFIKAYVLVWAINCWSTSN
jgi:hypothetical protein